MRTLRNYPTHLAYMNLALQFLTPSSYRLFSILNHWHTIRTGRFAWYTISSLARLTRTSRARCRVHLQELRAKHFLASIYYDHRQKVTFYTIPHVTTYYREQLKLCHPTLTAHNLDASLAPITTTSDMDRTGPGSWTGPVHNSPLREKIKQGRASDAPAPLTRSAKSHRSRRSAARQIPVSARTDPTPHAPDVAQEKDDAQELADYILTLTPAHALTFMAKSLIFAEANNLNVQSYLDFRDDLSPADRKTFESLCAAATEAVASLRQAMHKPGA